MRLIIASALFTTATATILGLTLIMSVDAAAYTLAMQAIGADTPVDGVTVGVILAGIMAGVGGLVVLARYLISFGGFVQQLKMVMADAVKYAEIVDRLNDRVIAVEAIEVRVATVERWRATIGHDYDDEEAGG